MSIFTLRRGWTARFLAVALTGYCMLASARGLMPRICATLSSLPDASASCCAKPPSCCDGPVSVDHWVALAVAPHDCAFCLIVNTPVQPVSADVPLDSRVPSELRLAAAVDGFVDAPTVDANASRAPPLA